MVRPPAPLNVNWRYVVAKSIYEWPLIAFFLDIHLPYSLKLVLQEINAKIDFFALILGALILGNVNFGDLNFGVWKNV